MAPVEPVPVIAGTLKSISSCWARYPREAGISADARLFAILVSSSTLPASDQRPATPRRAKMLVRMGSRLKLSELPEFSDRTRSSQSVGRVQWSFPQPPYVESPPPFWLRHRLFYRHHLRDRPRRSDRPSNFSITGDTTRKDTLLALKQEAIDFGAAIRRRISRTTYRFGSLPVELPHEIFSLPVEPDSAFLLTLSSFCKMWRPVALDSPSFCPDRRRRRSFQRRESDCGFKGPEVESSTLSSLKGFSREPFLSWTPK